jgi:hypothetical protein
MGGSQSFNLTGLTGREYKMLLEPGRFPGNPGEVADRLWSRLPPIFGPHLADADGLPALPDAKQRMVQFLDTDKLALDGQGYSLRLRRKENKKKSEVTLKLRTADIFLSGSTSLPQPAGVDTGNGEEGAAKFEEDIAPLEVQIGGNNVALPDDAGTRSRFSRSAGREKKGTCKLERYLNAAQLFPTLDGSLREAGIELSDDVGLNPGPEFDERVFKVEGVSLRDELDVDLTLTLWYFDDPGSGAEGTPLRVVELSFQWDFPTVQQDSDEAGRRLRRQARRAMNLFIGMQRAFWEEIDRQTSSKTKLGLPAPR